jgi:hypothetical protein
MDRGAGTAVAGDAGARTPVAADGGARTPVAGLAACIARRPDANPADTRLRPARSACRPDAGAADSEFLLGPVRSGGRQDASQVDTGFRFVCSFRESPPRGAGNGSSVASRRCHQGMAHAQACECSSRECRPGVADSGSSAASRCCPQGMAHAQACGCSSRACRRGVDGSGSQAASRRCLADSRQCSDGRPSRYRAGSSWATHRSGQGRTSAAAAVGRSP